MYICQHTLCNHVHVRALLGIVNSWQFNLPTLAIKLLLPSNGQQVVLFLIRIYIRNAIIKFGSIYYVTSWWIAVYI